MSTIIRCDKCGKKCDVKNNYSIEFFEDNYKFTKVYAICDECYEELEKLVKNKTNKKEKENEN